MAMENQLRVMTFLVRFPQISPHLENPSNWGVFPGLRGSGLSAVNIA
jgi:hypothetical protein